MYALVRVSAAQTEFFAALNDACHGVMIDFHAVFNLLLDMLYVLRSRGFKFMRILAPHSISTPASALVSPLRFLCPVKCLILMSTAGRNKAVKSGCRMCCLVFSPPALYQRIPTPSCGCDAKPPNDQILLRYAA
jgi:hypothetical protein